MIPVYNSEATAIELCDRLAATLDAIGCDYEVILVDDGSSDGSADIFADQARKRPGFRLVRLLRNFGQHPALTAGTALARGRWTVHMDDDLQNPPEEIPKLYGKAQEGFDVVCGVRAKREDTLFRRLSSRFTQSLLNVVIREQTADAISSFRIMSRRVVDDYRRLTEHHTYVAALVSWLGYPQASIAVRHDARRGRRSGYSLRHLFAIWSDILYGFSEGPLRLVSLLGFGLSGLAFALLARNLFIYFFKAENPVMGYTSLFGGIMFFAGVNLICLGVIGEYIRRINREIKNRPRYIIDHRGSVPPVDVEGRAR